MENFVRVRVEARRRGIQKKGAGSSIKEQLYEAVIQTETDGLDSRHKIQENFVIGEVKIKREEPIDMVRRKKTVQRLTSNDTAYENRQRPQDLCLNANNISLPLTIECRHDLRPAVLSRGRTILSRRSRCSRCLLQALHNKLHRAVLHKPVPKRMDDTVATPPVISRPVVQRVQRQKNPLVVERMARRT